MAKVLIVDDESNNRLLLKTLLQHAGHTVCEAAGGYQALQCAIEQQPDVIVVDLSLPDLPGPKLLAKLRSDERTAHCALALYTATTSSPALEELAQTYGISAFIPKPGEPKEVLSIFERLTGDVS